jgi:F420H(2)-dependent quinone reductase
MHASPCRGFDPRRRCSSPAHGRPADPEARRANAASAATAASPDDRARRDGPAPRALPGERRQVGGRIGAGRVLLLTTIGRRSGRPRTAPLAYLPDGGRLVVIAAFGGADVHPAWFLNLLACADVEVELAGQPMRRMRASPAPPELHASLWHKATALYPRCAAYQRRTTRPIPVVILQPS